MKKLLSQIKEEKIRKGNLIIRKDTMNKPLNQIMKFPQKRKPLMKVPLSQAKKVFIKKRGNPMKNFPRKNTPHVNKGMIL